ncbi:DNA cytosine methyltransferase [Rhizobium sp.]|uniref:DNA cytosine methyltransferase n=1 Tax=Rhizobium sp. TaxID=391 RepID=UPI00289B4F54
MAKPENDETTPSSTEPAKILAAAHLSIRKTSRLFAKKMVDLSHLVTSLRDVADDNFIKSLLIDAGIPSTEAEKIFRLSEIVRPDQDLITERAIDIATLNEVVAADNWIQEEVLRRMRLGHSPNAPEVRALAEHHGGLARSEKSDISDAWEALFDEPTKKAAADLRRRIESGAFQLINLTKRIRRHELRLTQAISHRRRATMERLLEQRRLQTIVTAQALLQDFDRVFPQAHTLGINWLTSENKTQQNLWRARDAVRRLSEGEFEPLGLVGLSRFQAQARRSHLRYLAGPDHHAIKKNATQRRLHRLNAADVSNDIGGTALGMERSFFRIVAKEYGDKPSRSIAAVQRPVWKLFADPRSTHLTAEAIERALSDRKGNRYPLQILSGSAPQMPESRKGGRDLQAAALARFRTLTTRLQPEGFFFETQRSYQEAAFSGYRAEFIGTLEAAGYTVQETPVDGRVYGLAQQRNRVLIIGVKHKHATRLRRPLLERPFLRTISDALTDPRALFPYMSTSAISGTPTCGSVNAYMHAYDTYALGWLEKFGKETVPDVAGVTGYGKTVTQAWAEVGFAHVNQHPITPMRMKDGRRYDNEQRPHEKGLAVLTVPALMLLQGLPIEWARSEIPGTPEGFWDMARRPEEIQHLTRAKWRPMREAETTAVTLGKTLVHQCVPPVIARVASQVVYDAISGMVSDLDEIVRFHDKYSELVRDDRMSRLEEQTFPLGPQNGYYR